MLMPWKDKAEERGQTPCRVWMKWTLSLKENAVIAEHILLAKTQSAEAMRCLFSSFAQKPGRQAKHEHVELLSLN